MDTNYILPSLIAFLITMIVAPIIIPYLTKLKFGQFVRDDGPKSHLKKSGTPTMGGVIFLVGIFITSLLYLKTNMAILPILILTMGYGVIGFVDDFIKIARKRSLGLKAYQKLIAQLILSVFFCYYLINYANISTDIMIPFSKGYYIDLGVWFIPFNIFVILGTVNGVNLTDGLDGLATSVTVLVATFFTVVSIGLKTDISPITLACVGSLLAFLIFNSYPAKVFMGDTGSLALGGFVVGVAIYLQMPLFIPIVGFIYLLETLSVMIQVGYYKKTKKRVFMMAPIHHHYELKGWNETKIVVVFGIITAVLCLIGLYALNGFF
jgi:phospho-N-acetylmuramoyl-pentapeptide-transferase